MTRQTLALIRTYPTPYLPFLPLLFACPQNSGVMVRGSIMLGFVSFSSLLDSFVAQEPP